MDSIIIEFIVSIVIVSLWWLFAFFIIIFVLKETKVLKKCTHENRVRIDDCYFPNSLGTYKCKKCGTIFHPRFEV